MADLGRWFKLWCASDDDDHLDALAISDFGRWCKLGTHTKKHGNDGTVQIVAPAPTLCAKFQVATFDDLMLAIRRFPNIEISTLENSVGVTVANVTWRNWAKYQGDFSADRVAKFRCVKRPKKRGEERRREEKRGEATPLIPKGDDPFDRFWKAYPKKTGKLAAKRSWERAKINGSLDAVLAAVEAQKKSQQWQKDGGQYIPNPSTWINQGRWMDATEPTRPAYTPPPKTDADLEWERRYAEQQKKRQPA